MSWARRAIIVILLLASGLFFYAYYTQYFIWRDCFNELGRCYDSEEGIVYLEQSGIIWMSLTLICAGTGLAVWWRGRRK